MKPLLSILPFIAACSLLLTTTASALAQQPEDDETLLHTPDKTLVHTPAGPHPAANSTEEPDVFDALKKSITKVQKQTKEVKELEPQVKALRKQQDEMQQELAEGKERLHAVLVHQAEEIRNLQTTVERLETELKALRSAAPSPTPTPASSPSQP